MFLTPWRQTRLDRPDRGEGRPVRGQRLAAAILSVIPPRRTSMTRSHQMDGITDLTCKDGTAHQLVDGWEPTHNWLVPESTRWTRGCSSVGQSRRLITARSQVRGLPAPQSK